MGRANNTGADANGAGVYIENASIKLLNSVISDNDAANLGGGIYVEGASSSLTVVNSVIHDKKSRTGAGIYITGAPSGWPPLSLINTTVSRNNAGTWHSLVQGRTAVALNLNLDGATDPQFTDPAAGNFRLKDGSPAINTGSNSLYGATLSTDKDPADNPRLWGSSIDMGAYENQSAIALPVTFGNISAIVRNGELFVSWTAETETNNDHFLIQLSADGHNFSTVKTITSKAADGNSTEPLEYSSSIPLTALGLSAGLLLLAGIAAGRRCYGYIMAVFTCCVLAFACSKQDVLKSIENSKCYLRIVQVDKDGREGLSKVIKVLDNDQ